MLMAIKTTVTKEKNNAPINNRANQDLGRRRVESGVKPPHS
jgi:hypothetical protein